MITVPHQQRQHPTAFHPHRIPSSPHSPEPIISDRQIPRPASSSDTDLDQTSIALDLFGLDSSSVYSTSPMSQTFYSGSNITQSSSPLQAHSRPSQASWYEPRASLEASYPHRIAYHQRNTSSSSVGSNASASSSQAYSQSSYSLGHSDSSPLMAANKFESYPSSTDDAARTFSNTLPTPTYTPTQDSFVYNYTSQAPNLESTMAAHLALKQDVLDRNSMVEEDIPGFTHSARQSVSSFGNSPSTPHVDDIDDALRASTTGETSALVENWMDEYLLFDDEADMTRHSIPAYDKVLQGNIKDEFATAMNMNIQPSQFQQQNQAFLSPFAHQNPKLQELLQQKANKNRSQSPSSFTGRPASPYRHGSPLVMHQGRLDTTCAQSPLRQQQGMRAFARQAQQQANEADTPKTISPKDSLLEHTESEEDSKQIPLFSDTSATDFAQQQQQQQAAFGVSNQFGGFAQNHFDGTSNWMTGQQTTAPTSQAAFTFTAPAVDTSHRNLMFPAQSYRSVGMTSAPEPTPDFPAHLTSMESSISEAPEPLETTEIKRPSSTLADAGTYSCTYHGCAHRFDSPQRLQKHKREAHRQNPNSNASSPIGSNMSAADLLARNSQAGPHKCSRVNPTTGKPCNTVFSRPYDLTRHEDTIHNNIKQKVRCAYCVEEKTFSRNDALTRHMRVVHSDVNFPGKHRRRGQE